MQQQTAIHTHFLYEQLSAAAAAACSSCVQLSAELSTNYLLNEQPVDKQL